MTLTEEGQADEPEQGPGSRKGSGVDEAEVSSWSLVEEVNKKLQENLEKTGGEGSEPSEAQTIAQASVTGNSQVGGHSRLLALLKREHNHITAGILRVLFLFPFFN